MSYKIVKYFSLIFFVTVTGCAGSNPRFKSKEPPQNKNTQISKEYRFSYEKAKKEEIAEDDRKVDIPSVKEKFLHPAESAVPDIVPRDKVLTEVMGLIGTPYAYSGESEDGMDCSGFACRVYEKSMGIKLPRSTEEQFRSGKKVENLQFGDLVFFNTTGRVPSHVGIFIGDDLFAHSSLSVGVTVSSLQSTYYKKRYVGARRVVE